MERDLFYRLGKWLYTARVWVMLFWMLILIGCLPFIPKLMEPFKEIGFVDQNSQSVKADNFLKKHLGYGTNRFIVIYSSKQLKATDSLFQERIKDSLKKLKKIPVTSQIIYPQENKSQISKDKHTAYAVVLFKSTSQYSDEKILDLFKQAVKEPKDMKMLVGGEPVFMDDVKTQTQHDLYRVEYIATPIAIITMLIVFGSLVAASLPIVMGGFAALLILTLLSVIGNFYSLSVFTINIALLLGLCLSLDYALLIVSRYRDELKRKKTAKAAIAITLATAGKSVFFSGIAVFISLSALLLFKVNVLFSVGVGGIVSVFVAVVLAIILLPTILTLLHKRINKWSIPWFKNANSRNNTTYWRFIATAVVRRPGIYFASMLAFLLFCGYPFLDVKLGLSDFRILPKTLESRQAFDLFSTKFGENQLNSIFMIIKTNQKNILSENNVSKLYSFADRIKRDSRIEAISSIVNTTPRLTKSQYQMMYSNLDQVNPGIKTLLATSTHQNFTVFTLTSKFASNDAEIKDLISDLRALKPGDGMTVQVTGTAATNQDVLQSILKTFPYAFLWIVGFTYLILLVSLRSLVLPLKAIITTILSLSASYGLLVLVFQYGYLHELLHFDPQHMLDISLLIIIFCALFGVSMDYEVFLLTRIKEYYEQTGSNVRSIIFGIDHSGKIITSAAIIVILLCFSFMSAGVLVVKAFGLGIAVAVFVDAFLIRTILVPATMDLLGSWNWYLPKWLDRLLPKLSYDPRKKAEHRLIGKKDN